MLGVHLTAPFLLAKQFLPSMISKGDIYFVVVSVVCKHKIYAMRSHNNAQNFCVDVLFYKLVYLQAHTHSSYPHTHTSPKPHTHLFCLIPQTNFIVKCETMTVTSIAKDEIIEHLQNILVCIHQTRSDAITTPD